MARFYLMHGTTIRRLDNVFFVLFQEVDRHNNLLRPRLTINYTFDPNDRDSRIKMYESLLVLLRKAEEWNQETGQERDWQFIERTGIDLPVLIGEE